MASLSLYLLTRPARIEVRQNSVLEITLERELPELPPTTPVVQIFERDSVSVIDLDRLLRAAAKDQRIAGVYVAIHPLGNSWAQIEEMAGLVPLPTAKRGDENGRFNEYGWRDPESGDVIKFRVTAGLIDSGFGPIKTKPLPEQISAKWAFSARNP